MSYYYYLPERVGTGHGKAVGELELCMNEEGRPSLFLQGSVCNISGEKGHQYGRGFTRRRQGSSDCAAVSLAPWLNYPGRPACSAPGFCEYL